MLTNHDINVFPMHSERSSCLSGGHCSGRSDKGVMGLRRAPRTFRQLHEKCKKCGHPFHDHFNPDDECWCGCMHFSPLVILTRNRKQKEG